MATTLVKRSDKLAFLKIGSTYQRMTGFTALTTNKNPVEYSRQYVDEDFENTDVTGYSPSIDFTFDQYSDSVVHDALISIIEGEKTSTSALVTILIVDKAEPITGGTYYSYIRQYAVVGGSEGDSTDAYTYSGTFKVKGARTEGKTTLSADESTATFTAGGASI